MLRPLCVADGISYRKHTHMFVCSTGSSQHSPSPFWSSWHTVPRASGPASPLPVTESPVTVIWSNAGGDPVTIHLSSPVQHHRNCEAAAEQPQSQGRREGSAARLRADAGPGSRVVAPAASSDPPPPSEPSLHPLHSLRVKGDTSVGRFSAEGRVIVSEGNPVWGLYLSTPLSCSLGYVLEWRA